MPLIIPVNTAGAQRKLEVFFGITPETQRAVGTFMLVFSMVEQAAEVAVLALSGEALEGRAPSTDRMMVSDLFKAIRRQIADAEDQAVRDLFASAADMGDDLAAIRHTVAHGRPFADEGGPVLRRNSSWFGETRRREQTTFPLSVEMLDQASAAADLLFMTLVRLAATAAQIDGFRIMALELGADLVEARQAIGQVRAQL